MKHHGWASRALRNGVVKKYDRDGAGGHAFQWKLDEVYITEFDGSGKKKRKSRKQRISKDTIEHKYAAFRMMYQFGGQCYLASAVNILLGCEAFVKAYLRPLLAFMKASRRALYMRTFCNGFPDDHEFIDPPTTPMPFGLALLQTMFYQIHRESFSVNNTISAILEQRLMGANDAGFNPSIFFYFMCMCLGLTYQKTTTLEDFQAQAFDADIDMILVCQDDTPMVKKQVPESDDVPRHVNGYDCIGAFLGSVGHVIAATDFDLIIDANGSSHTPMLFHNWRKDIDGLKALLLLFNLNITEMMFVYMRSDYVSKAETCMTAVQTPFQLDIYFHTIHSYQPYVSNKGMIVLHGPVIEVYGNTIHMWARYSHGVLSTTDTDDMPSLVMQSVFNFSILCMYWPNRSRDKYQLICLTLNSNVTDPVFAIKRVKNAFATLYAVLRMSTPSTFYTKHLHDAADVMHSMPNPLTLVNSTTAMPWDTNTRLENYILILNKWAELVAASDPPVKVASRFGTLRGAMVGRDKSKRKLLTRPF